MAIREQEMWFLLNEYRECRRRKIESSKEKKMQEEEAKAVIVIQRGDETAKLPSDDLEEFTPNQWQSRQSKEKIQTLGMRGRNS